MPYTPTVLCANYISIKVKEKIINVMSGRQGGSCPVTTQKDEILNVSILWLLSHAIILPHFKKRGLGDLRPPEDPQQKHWGSTVEESNSKSNMTKLGRCRRHNSLLRLSTAPPRERVRPQLPRSSPEHHGTVRPQPTPPPPPALPQAWLTRLGADAWRLPQESTS